MIPPTIRAKQTQIHPTVWHVSKEDAMVIALAELNRWEPTALYNLQACSNASLPAAAQGQPSCGVFSPPPPAGCVMPSCAKDKIVPNFRIADGFYTTFSRPTIEGCVAECVKNATHAVHPCTGTIWKAANASGLSNCGAVGQTCCCKFTRSAVAGDLQAFSSDRL